MNKILAEINLTDAPVGRIFDFGDSDKTIEDKYLADWVLLQFSEGEAGARIADQDASNRKIWDPDPASGVNLFGVCEHLTGGSP